MHDPGDENDYTESLYLVTVDVFYNRFSCHICVPTRLFDDIDDAIRECDAWQQMVNDGTALQQLRRYGRAHAGPPEKIIGTTVYKFSNNRSDGIIHTRALGGDS
ncbi:MAG: hypothetical protein ACOC0P_00685 [Planctomycetota bacterium]